MNNEVENINDNDSDLFDLEYLKSDNPWLLPFNLTDSELSEVIRLMTRVIIGSDQIAGFRERLSETLKKDQKFINDLVVAILTNRFLELKPYISGFDEFVKNLGLDGVAFEAEVEKKSDIQNKNIDDIQELSKKIKQYDWSSISPLEKRMALEEIGITQRQLNEFLKKNQ